MPGVSRARECKGRRRMVARPRRPDQSSMGWLRAGRVNPLACGFGRSRPPCRGLERVRGTEQGQFAATLPFRDIDGPFRMSLSAAPQSATALKETPRHPAECDALYPAVYSIVIFERI